MNKIEVCLEIGPEGTSAFAPEYPGCWVFGRTPERALVKMETVIAEWFEWMERHGEHIPTDMKVFKVEVAEMMSVDYNPVEAGKPEPLFWREVEPVTRRDIARTIRLMTYSREDLLSLVSSLEDSCLNWLPPNKPRTIRKLFETHSS